MGEVLHEGFGNWDAVVAAGALVAALFGVERRREHGSVKTGLVLSALLVVAFVVVTAVDVLLMGGGTERAQEGAGLDLAAAIWDATVGLASAAVFMPCGFWAGWLLAGPLTQKESDRTRSGQ